MQDKLVEYEFLDDDPIIEPPKIELKEKEKEKEKVESPKVELKKQKVKKPNVEFKESNRQGSFWYIVIIVLLLLLYFHAIYNVVQYNNQSKQEYYMNLLIYPLQTKRGYNTSVIPVNKDSSRVQYTVLKQLELHLSQNPSYIVLCMHHLQLEVEYQPICVLYNNKRSEFIHMISPFIIGNSRQQKEYVESSVSCTLDTIASRYEQVVVEWTSPHTHNNIYSVFDRAESVALQLVLDEMKGRTHCVLKDINKKTRN